MALRVGLAQFVTRPLAAVRELDIAGARDASNAHTLGCVAWSPIAREMVESYSEDSRLLFQIGSLSRRHS